MDHLNKHQKEEEETPRKKKEHPLMPIYAIHKYTGEVRFLTDKTISEQELAEFAEELFYRRNLILYPDKKIQKLIKKHWKKQNKPLEEKAKEEKAPVKVYLIVNPTDQQTDDGVEIIEIFSHKEAAQRRLSALNALRKPTLVPFMIEEHIVNQDEK